MAQVADGWRLTSDQPQWKEYWIGLFNAHDRRGEVLEFHDRSNVALRGEEGHTLCRDLLILDAYSHYAALQAAEKSGSAAERCVDEAIQYDDKNQIIRIGMMVNKPGQGIHRSGTAQLPGLGADDGLKAKWSEAIGKYKIKRAEIAERLGNQQRELDRATMSTEGEAWQEFWMFQLRRAIDGNTKAKGCCPDVKCSEQLARRIFALELYARVEREEARGGMWQNSVPGCASDIVQEAWGTSSPVITGDGVQYQASGMIYVPEDARARAMWDEAYMEYVGERK